MALTNKLTAIGDAIRAKNGETALYTLDEMPQKIAAIETGGGSGSSALPSEYREVGFLQSDGSQYIVSDYYPTGYTQIITSLYCSSTSAVFPYGVRNSDDTASFTFMTCTSNNSKANCRYGSQTIIHSTYLTNIDLIQGYSFNNNNASLSVYNGVNCSVITSGTYINVEEFTSTLPLYIFNCNQDGAATSSGFKGNLYKLTIRENGIKVRDFIPCYRISDSTPGLYDIVNGNFFTNAGSGEFSFPEYNI